jgi:type IV pilus assembly protein PilA
MVPEQNVTAPAKKKNPALIIVVLLLGGLSLCCVVGILAAIAVPNFIKFQARAKQAEAKANLRAAYTAERAYFAEKNAYSADVGELVFSPQSGNRYLYAFSSEGDLAPPGSDLKGKTGVLADASRHDGLSNEALEQGVPAPLWDEVGVQGTCPNACSITIVAAGNVDTDDTVDVWSVSTVDRTIDGQTVPAGTPHNHVNDTAE